MEYEEFEKLLNSGQILEAGFGIDGYVHYGHCKIVYVEGKSQDNVFYPYIEFILTTDGKEGCRCHKRFNGQHKIFHFKGKGNYTFKDVWKKAIFTYVKYKDGREADSLE